MKISTTLFGDLAFLPFQADAPMTENMSFLTDVQTAQDSTEERVQLRTAPRHTLSYNMPLQAWQMQEAFNTEYGGIRLQWAVPLWYEWQFVGDVAASAASIVADTSIFDFREDSLALLYTSADLWQIIEISTLTGSLVNVSNTLVAQTNCYLMPIRLGWIADNVSKSINGFNGASSMDYEIDDDEYLTPSAPAQYLGDDIYFKPPVTGRAYFNRTIQSRVDKVDFSLGVIDRFAPWKNSRYATPYTSLLKTPTEIREYRNFLSRCAGRCRQFWMPTFERNLRLVTTGNIMTTIVIKKDSFNSFVVRNNIAIQKTDGTWSTNVVSSPTPAGANIQLTLATSLGYDASLIRNICYLGLYRLDNDNIHLDWIGNSIVQSTVNIIELSP